MWTPRLAAVDPTVASAGAAVLCTLLTRHLSSREAEIPSETLCWAILPVLFARTIRLDPGASNSVASSVSLWTVAANIAAVCCYRAEIGIIYLIVSIQFG